MAARAINVFVNCAFDPAFQPIFDGIVFAVTRCGFRARCALETDDASESRFTKIQKIVEECRYGIHDISRTQTDGDPALPRFNMPLELGLFLGAKRFGDAAQKRKRVLVLDTERYRFQRFISDIAGQDIHSHDDDPATAIAAVTDWLRTTSGRTSLPGGRRVVGEFLEFQAQLPIILAARRLDPDEVGFTDLVSIIGPYVDSL
jgi:hypothetical protein